jgi:hypothetical protein
MPDTSLLEAAAGDGGLIAVDRLSVLLHITRVASLHRPGRVARCGRQDRQGSGACDAGAAPRHGRNPEPCALDLRQDARSPEQE